VRAKLGPPLRGNTQTAIDTLLLYMAPDHYTRLDGLPVTRLAAMTFSYAAAISTVAGPL
jgi:hypothetical protein